MHTTCIVITLFFAFLSVEGVPYRSIKAPKPVHTSVKAIPSVLVVGQPTATSISCSEVGDPTVDPATRWQLAGADEALINAVQYYRNQSSEGGSLTLSRAVSHYFNGPEDYDCQLIDGPCSAGVGKCETVSSPAGWLILNSFSNFHNLWSNVNTALQDAETDITPQLGTFTSTFAPAVQDDTEMTKILFDISNTLLSVFKAYIGFEAGFIKNPESEYLSKGSDKGISALVGVLSGTQSLEKDLLPAAEQEQINEGQLGTDLSEITNAMQKTYSQMVANFSETGIFDSASPPINLEELFFNGTWVNSTLSTIDNRDLKIDFEHALYGLLAERAWRLTSEIYPAVVIMNETCDIDAQFNTIYNDVPKARSCAIDGVTIYVFGIQDVPAENIRYSPTPKYLPGGDTDTLTGDSGTWGGLTIDDIAISSYNGFIANGNQPGCQMPNTTNIIEDGQVNTDPFPLQDGVRTPGFFNIPTCYYDTMATMLDTKDSSYNNRGPNWPCQP